MKWITFREYMVWREGLWLNDDKAIEGMSKLPQPEPKKKPKPKPLPAVKPIRVTKMKTEKPFSKKVEVGTLQSSPT